MSKIIGRGAEAVLYKDGEVLIKDRIKKSYRVKELDEILRKRRTKSEARIINKAKRAGVPTPAIYEAEDSKIKMEFIGGERIKEFFPKASSKERKEVAEKIGQYIGTLHSFEIIHGDLTTSNMILKDDIYFIDFGLGFHSKSVEDRAIDLHLLYGALKSTHFQHIDEIWSSIIKGYKEKFKDWKDVLTRLEQIRKRGRYVKR